MPLCGCLGWTQLEGDSMPGFLPKLASQPHPTGADPCVCAGPCSGALHPAGDLLVGAAQNGCFKPQLLAVGGGTLFLALDLTQAEVGHMGATGWPCSTVSHHALSWL